jgi:uncharacterized membrane protein
MTKRAEEAHPPFRQLRHLLALAAILLVAFVLRIWLLGDQNLWWDEGLAIWAVRQSPLRMTLWTASDVHPPLYFWLLQLFVRLGGESEFAARFLSLVCGTLTVAALYALGKALLDRRIALWGALLLAVARFHVWWSQEMRMYVVATLWGVISVYACVSWLRAEGLLPPLPDRPQAGRQGAARQAILFVLATTAGLYSLYLFVTIVLIENVFFLVTWFRGKDRRLRHIGRWVALQVTTGVLFAPWLVLALPRMHSWSVAEPFDFGVFLQLYGTLLTLGISTYIARYSLLVAPFFLVVGAALLLLWRSRTAEHGATACARLYTHTAFLLLLFLIIPPSVVYALTLPRGFFYAPRVEARYLVLFAPAFYLLLAFSLVVLYRRLKWVGLAAAAFVIVAFLWSLPGHYSGRYLRDEHQTMVRIVSAYAEPGDAVLLVAGSRYPIFGYYYGRLPLSASRPPVFSLPQNAPQVLPDTVDGELAPLASTHTRLWLAQVNAPMQDPQGLVTQWLDQRYEKLLSFGFAYNALTLYGPPGSTAQVHTGNIAPEHVLDKPLGANVRLYGYDLPTQRFRPGDVVRLALYYSSPTDASVQVRLTDRLGRALEQRDITLAASPVSRHQLDFVVYAHTPGGLYHFEVEAVQSSDQCSFGSLRIEGTSAAVKALPAEVRVSGYLENGIELLGFTLRGAGGRQVDSIRAGESVTLDLYWRAARKTPRGYTVFTHLVGQAYNPATSGPVWAAHDGEPQTGGRPTSQWFVDETIPDRHILTVDSQTPEGEYELEVGMYLLETMTRLSSVDAQGQVLGDRLVLGRYPVVHP